MITIYLERKISKVYLALRFRWIAQKQVIMLKRPG
jgi:hypothetical protein